MSPRLLCIDLMIEPIYPDMQRASAHEYFGQGSLGWPCSCFELSGAGGVLVLSGRHFPETAPVELLRASLDGSVLKVR
jgi:hypothetical protein